MKSERDEKYFSSRFFIPQIFSFADFFKLTFANFFIIYQTITMERIDFFVLILKIRNWVAQGEEVANPRLRGLIIKTQILEGGLLLLYYSGIFLTKLNNTAMHFAPMSRPIFI